MKIKSKHIRTFSALLQQLIRGESLLVNNIYHDDPLFDETETAIRECFLCLEFLGYNSEVLETLYNHDRFEALMEELNKPNRQQKILTEDTQTFCNLFARNLRLLDRIEALAAGLYPGKRKEFRRGFAYALNLGANTIDEIFADNGVVLFSPTGETNISAIAAVFENAPTIITDVEQQGQGLRDLLSGVTNSPHPIIERMLLAQKLFGGGELCGCIDCSLERAGAV